MLFECLKGDAPQRMTFILQTYPSVVHKNMLKAWSFNENKLHRRCFDNNLLNILRTNILENGTEQIVLIVALMVSLCLIIN